MTKLIKATTIFIKVISVSVAVFLLFLVVALFGVRLFGVQVFTVLSGSMEPSYPVGSVIYVKDVDPDTLWVRDVVTFKTEQGIIVTHRIVSVESSADDPDAVCFYTKGDANENTDTNLLTADSIIGEPFFMIPKIGFIADFMHSGSGRVICIVLMGLLVLLNVLSGYLKSCDEPNPIKKKE